MDRLDTRAIWDANAPAWIELSRAGFDVDRDLVNAPAFLELLPPLEGARCLDLGRGEGHDSRLLEAGFEVTAIAEPCADEETATLDPEVADSRIAPYVLILQAPGAPPLTGESSTTSSAISPGRSGRSP